MRLMSFATYQSPIARDILEENILPIFKTDKAAQILFQDRRQNHKVYISLVSGFR
jgi:hypothetical protein